ncbi:NECB-like protein [Mya arenaria]|uniref:NECB-like protein n=2 Tax=Mya arenaria TaxID=6604 RepID=A0ABY7G2Q5_MYAAR|nr:NECB-like protein [Mya arenaria]
MIRILCYPLVLLHICYCLATNETDSYEIYIVVQSKEIHLNSIKESMEMYYFHFKSKINNKLFIFEKNNGSDKRRLHTDELEGLRKSNNHIDQSLFFNQETPLAAQTVAYEHDPEENNLMYVCPPVFDEALGIDRTWSHTNITGRGVVIGVTDVGIDTENIHLKQNINHNLSFNFVDNHPVTNPTQIWEIIESKKLTSHGNGCAGLISGAKTNQYCDACGVGVAYNSKVADLQIAKITKRFWHYPKFNSATYAAALAHKPDEIHIYSNSWGINKPFHSPMFCEDDVLTEGMKNGRRGLGSVYVFPAGFPGAAFSNHIATVTVACLGFNGAVHEVSKVNSAVLVSVFCNGRSRSDTRMITVGHDSDSCLTEFGGESAGSAIVSGIIALLLEANPELSSRDVKHILIQSSGHMGIEASPEFLQNAAGYMYHPNLGFGYPNATMMVSIGSNWKSLQPLSKKTLEIAKDDLQIRSTYMYERVSYVDTFCDSTQCIDIMEEVVFDANFIYTEQHYMKLWVVSPNGTISTLTETKPVNNQEKSRRRVQAKFRINHFWGENSSGRWRIYISCNISKNDEDAFYDCHIAHGKLFIYGIVQKRNFGYDKDTSHLQAVVNKKQSSTTMVNYSEIKPTTVEKRTQKNVAIFIEVSFLALLLSLLYNFKVL